ncbi:hypothetical protein E1264_20055 [Actinomadura sp. KC216]|nr:hypothetical protein E1264_20055 [Actinomadura sp. KC216]
MTVTGLKVAKVVGPLVKRVAPKILDKLRGKPKGGGAGTAGNPAAKTAPAAAKNPGKAAASRPASSGRPPCNSFVPSASVLMADGTRKPIKDVKVGDKVQATDPATGRTTAQPVVATITGVGSKPLVQLTIDTDGKKGHKTGVLTATDGHPFWTPTTGTWTEAGKLKPGMWLRTSAGTHVQITAIKPWTTHRQRVHNLTVADAHTYYVLSGATPVLVHNCGDTDEQPSHLYHYTDYAGRAAIRFSERILPVAEGEGSIYLSPDGYTSAAEARSKLAMTRANPTGYFKIPMERIRNAIGPAPVRPWPPGSGDGGGAEYFTQEPIDAVPGEDGLTARGTKAAAASTAS